MTSGGQKVVKKKTTFKNIDLKIDKRLVAMARSQGSRKKLTTPGSKSSTKQRQSLLTYQRFRNQLDSKAFMGSSGNFIEETIILDIGGRYSKIGFVGEPGPRRICKTHLRLGDYRKSCPYVSQKFKAGVPLLPVVLSLSKKPLSIQTWQEIAELLVDDLLFKLNIHLCTKTFMHLIDSQLEIKPDKRRIIILQDAWWPTPFQNSLARSFFRHQCPGVQFVDSLHTALFCTGKSSGMILDIGYHTSKIQASVHGHILAETRGWKYVGFYSIMQEFKKLMRELAKLDFNEFRVSDEQIENAISRTCFVQPLNASASEMVPNSVSFEFNVKKQSAFCKITPSIRRRICDVLFDERRTNIVHFLCDTLLKAPLDCRELLINNILLTGGTCQIPGFEARFIQEFKHAMKMNKYRKLRNMQNRFRILKCDFPHNIRMFSGASIYGDITSRFVEELFITKKQFESSFVKERIYDWTEEHQMSEELLNMENEENINGRHRASSGRTNSAMDIATLNAFKNANSLGNINYPESGLNKKSTVGTNELRPITNITHAEIVRKPQYRGRPTYNLAQTYQKSSGFTTPRKTVDITQRISTAKRRSMDVMPVRSQFDRPFPDTERALMSLTPTNSDGYHSNVSTPSNIVLNLKNENNISIGLPSQPLIRNVDSKYERMRKTVKYSKVLDDDEDDGFSSQMSSFATESIEDLSFVDSGSSSNLLTSRLPTRTPVTHEGSNLLQDSGVLPEGDEDDGD